MHLVFCVLKLAILLLKLQFVDALDWFFVLLNQVDELEKHFCCQPSIVITLFMGYCNIHWMVGKINMFNIHGDVCG